MLTFSIKRRIRRFPVVVARWTSTKCTEKRVASAELLFCSQNQLFFYVVLVVVAGKAPEEDDEDDELLKYFEIEQGFLFQQEMA